MKKIITALCFLLIYQNLTSAQFVTYDPPIGSAIRDLDANGETLLIATDQGFLKFESLLNWSTYTTAEGMPSNDIKCIGVQGNSIQVGTSAKYLTTYSSGSLAYDTLNTVTSYGYISYVKYLNNKWAIGTNNGVVFELNGAILTKKSYPSAALGRITGLNQTTNGIFTVLSTNGVVLDYGTGYLYIDQTTALPSNNVICGSMANNISYDGTDAGLYKANFQGGLPPTVFTYSTSNSGLPSNRIQAIAIYNDTIWVGTDKGLAKWYNTTQWEVYDTSNSNIPSNNISEIAITANGRVWIATDDGTVSTFGETTAIPPSDDFNPKVVIYPNPVHRISKVILGKRYQKITLTIFDQLGREYRTPSYSRKQDLEIDMSKLQKGLYFVKLILDEKMEVVNVVKD